MPRVSTRYAPGLERQYWAKDFAELCFSKMGRSLTDEDIAKQIGCHVNTVRRHWRDGKWQAQEVRMISKFLRFTDEEKQKIWG